MKKQGRQKPQSQAQNCPGKGRQRGRDIRVIQLRVQRQKGGPKKENQRQANKEEDPLEIPLPPVPEDDNDPEKGQQRPRRQNNQPRINGVVQVQACASREFYDALSSTAIAKCRLFLALPKLLKLDDLKLKENQTESPPTVRQILDMQSISAILAVDCEEC
jgi:hypothetical protein